MPYPLATLLEVRENEERAAAAALARAQDDEARAAARLAAATREEATRRGALRDGRVRHEEAIAAGKLTAAEVQAGDRWLGTLVGRLEEARAAVATREKERHEKAAAVEQARDALAAAVRARKSLDQHREAWEDEQKATAERKAEDELDDLAGRRRDR